VTRKLLLAAMLLGVGGCNFWYNEVPSPDDLMHKIPWFDHMIKSKAVHPYSSSTVPRNTPKGSIPVGGGEADWRTGDMAMSAFPFDTNYAKHLTRPSTPPAPGARSGQQVFEIYCSACHGFGGAGDGTIASYFAVKSLLTPAARGLADGTIYSILKYGRALMPMYGDKIYRADERWAVVEYVRSLQAKSPVTPVAGAK
jgi:mono/diheme cytochrome c family protein